MDILPDLGSLSDEELKQLKAELEQQRPGGRAVLRQVDVATLTETPAGKSTPEP